MVKPCMQCILSNHLCLQCVCPCNVLGPTHPLTHLHWLVPQWVMSHQSLSVWFSQRGQEHVLAMEFHLHRNRHRDKYSYLYSIINARFTLVFVSMLTTHSHTHTYTLTCTGWVHNGSYYTTAGPSGPHSEGSDKSESTHPVYTWALMAG